VDTYPKTRLRDLAELSALLTGTLARRGDAGEAISGWLRGLTQRYQSPNIILDLYLQRILFVSGPELSAHILSAAPSTEGFVAGTMKRRAMSFLAPHALTILDGADWKTFRAYNEEVLTTGRPHPHLPVVLTALQKAFTLPAQNIDDIRQRMGRAMLAIVFGEGNAPAHLIDDILELFAEVNLGTALVGSRKTALRDRFRDELRHLWQSSAGTKRPCLLARARGLATEMEGNQRREEIVLDQIPHWMFTFTNSGSDLLARTLGIIMARQETLELIRHEVAATGSTSLVETIHGLTYLEACILEAGRLYPPSPQTAHCAARDQTFENTFIPAGIEVLQFFPFTNRDTLQDPFANHFRPERWLDPAESMSERYPNLFLSGARACPGRDLILFVVKAAIAVLLSNGKMQAQRSTLSDDPLPFSFP
jgi:cytochrome P450